MIISFIFCDYNIIPPLPPPISFLEASQIPLLTVFKFIAFNITSVFTDAYTSYGIYVYVNVCVSVCIHTLVCYICVCECVCVCIYTYILQKWWQKVCKVFSFRMQKLWQQSFSGYFLTPKALQLRCLLPAPPPAFLAFRDNAELLCGMMASILYICGYRK